MPDVCAAIILGYHHKQCQTSAHRERKPGENVRNARHRAAAFMASVASFSAITTMALTVQGRAQGPSPQPELSIVSALKSAPADKKDAVVAYLLVLAKTNRDGAEEEKEISATLKKNICDVEATRKFINHAEDRDSALTIGEGYIALCPTNVDVTWRVAQMQFAKGRYVETIALLNSIEPQYSKSTLYYNRGMALHYQGSHQQAVSDMKKYLSLNPNINALPKSFFDAYATSLEKIGQPCEGMKILYQYVNSDPAKRATDDAAKRISELRQEGKCQ